MNGRHGGNVNRLAEEAGRAAEDLLDFSANINPLGPPAWLPALIAAQIGALAHYPDPYCADLVKAIGETRGVPEEEIIVGNGSSELLYLLPRALGAKRALIPVPAYGDYAVAAALAGLVVVKLPLAEKDGFRPDLAELEGCLRKDDVVFIGQPANPTGHLCAPGELRALAALHPEAYFVVDEAFADFIDGLDRLTDRRPANMVVLCSLTKFYAIPGLRLGYAAAAPETARRLREMIPTWSVNTLAQAAGEKALRDEEYGERTRRTVCALREQLRDRLSALPGLTVYPGAANYLLARLDSGPDDGLNAPTVARRLLAEGIAIRVCDTIEGLDGRFFRVAVRTQMENARLCRALENVLGAAAPKTDCGTPAPVKRPRPKPAVMFQGTCSHAGKSVLAAALCRILLQDGYRVAPFKAQNMSLNSSVTAAGGEIGRAQAVQAQACRVEADVRMNPLLLKPSTDTGSQVIVLGKPAGTMNFTAYTRHHDEYARTAWDAYDSLARDYDVLVLEGAGSPAEVNLLAHDIANMKTARHAGAPVLLVGNIDRGGVYASFVGTMEVLPPADRALIAGFIVNRFRGAASLLGDAHDYVRERTGRPVLGVVPELFNLGLPEEDSVGFREGAFSDVKTDESSVEIAVIDFAHISNFTDLDPLRIEPDVHLTLVRTPDDLGTPDAVILPGSKNVVADLEMLTARGLADKLQSLHRSGRTEIIGICGGFQMLGRRIADPHRIESAGKTLPGLGLLPFATILAPEKLLARTAATHRASGLTVHGYEIHHGRTEDGEARPLIVKADGEAVGSGNEDGSVWGTYLHGIFDDDAFRHWFLDHLRTKRGLAPLGTSRASYDLEPAFDRLAQAVRESIDIDRIYRVMGIR